MKNYSRIVISNEIKTGSFELPKCYRSLIGDFGTPGGKKSGPERKMIVICPRNTVATLQQCEFGLQQNDAEVTIRPTALLQICTDAQKQRTISHSGRVAGLGSALRRPGSWTGKKDGARLRAGERRGLGLNVADPAAAFSIVPATPHDVPAILAMIQALADFEKLRPLCVATEADVYGALFGPRPAAEVVVGWEGATAVAFALFFHNFSTFLGRKGLYLEDLFVQPTHRGRGYGQALLVHLARIAVARECGRFEWAVLDWNAAAMGFYASLGATVLPDWRITRLTGSALAKLAARPAAGS